MKNKSTHSLFQKHHLVDGEYFRSCSPSIRLSLECRPQCHTTGLDDPVRLSLALPGVSVKRPCHDVQAVQATTKNVGKIMQISTSTQQQQQQQYTPTLLPNAQIIRNYKILFDCCPLKIRSEPKVPKWIGFDDWYDVSNYFTCDKIGRRRTGKTKDVSGVSSPIVISFSFLVC